MRAAGLACLFLLVACGGEQPDVTVHAIDGPPAALSEWGVLIASGDTLHLNDAVVPYELNTPLFSDYAQKLRTVWLPDGKAAAYSDHDVMDFPAGTIISKTFYYEKADGFSADTFRVVKTDYEPRLTDRTLDLDEVVLVETRLLVRYAEGWRALPYVWNDEQTEAWLELAGDVQNVTHVSADGEEAFVYVVPDANQCSGCHVVNHTTKYLQPIGPRAWQLNRDFAYTSGNENQLDYWSKNRLVVGVPESPPEGVSWSTPGDATLEARAKAYLDSNCAHCHNANGAADTSALDLAITHAVDRDYGVCKPPVAVGRGSGDRPYDIYPGRPEDSILLYRMQHSDPAIAMPELGRSTVHAEGVALIQDWIAAMPGSC